jgi:hypothetical protein
MYRPTNARDANTASNPEECALGSRNESFQGAWGWANARCSNCNVYICRGIRAQPAIHSASGLLEMLAVQFSA